MNLIIKWSHPRSGVSCRSGNCFIFVETCHDRFQKQFVCFCFSLTKPSRATLGTMLYISSGMWGSKGSKVLVMIFFPDAKSFLSCVSPIFKGVARKKTSPSFFGPWGPWGPSWRPRVGAMGHIRAPARHLRVQWGCNGAHTCPCTGINKSIYQSLGCGGFTMLRIMMCAYQWTMWEEIYSSM